ncbi:MAG TPA: YbhB/YbcL family Raf kinase inhibitor-like protein, partial [Chitinophagaceae bacterium]|nr:YbhB/YbcL family Raf kinase inhibitor-like protein [Chitinophagaceae bacterium]
MAIERNDLEVRSLAFSQNGHIPPKYTCEGENINPPLEINNIPDEAKSLVLIMEDPDASEETFVHWLLWNISPNDAIAEQSNAGISGKNGYGKTGYAGPCPPSGSHRYFFKVFALDTELDLLAGAGKEAVVNAMSGHVIAKGELMGYYQKKKVA